MDESRSVPPRPEMGGMDASVGGGVREVLSLQSHQGWQSFELLPHHYRTTKRASRVLFAWTTAILVLGCLVTVWVVALWSRGQNTLEYNARLVATAKPIRELKRETETLKRENELLGMWSSWVESARPDDSLLQVLGAVTQATSQDAKNIEVRSVEVKLPLEYGLQLSNAPAWAEPRFSMTAKISGPDTLLSLSQRLEKETRLSELKLNAPSGSWNQTLIQVGAKPASTRVLP